MEKCLSRIVNLDQIYTLVFKKRAPIDFMDRSGFPRSAAFLRVNKLVYSEARVFVYGENRFCFGYNFAKSGNYFGTFVLELVFPCGLATEVQNNAWEARGPLYLKDFSVALTRASNKQC